VQRDDLNDEYNNWLFEKYNYDPTAAEEDENEVDAATLDYLASKLNAAHPIQKYQDRKTQLFFDTRAYDKELEKKQRKADPFFHLHFDEIEHLAQKTVEADGDEEEEAKPKVMYASLKNVFHKQFQEKRQFLDQCCKNSDEPFHMPDHIRR